MPPSSAFSSGTPSPQQPSEESLCVRVPCTRSARPCVRLLWCSIANQTAVFTRQYFARGMRPLRPSVLRAGVRGVRRANARGGRAPQEMPACGSARLSRRRRLPNATPSNDSSAEGEEESR